MNTFIEFLAKFDQKIFVAWTICDFKILVTFCDLALTFKNTKYRISTLIVPTLKETVYLRKICIFYFVLNRILAKTDQNAK